MDYNKLWNILKEMGIPDHLTCNLPSEVQPKWLISGKAGIQVQVTALPMMPCIIRSPSHPPGPSWEALVPSRGRKETGEKVRTRKGRILEREESALEKHIPQAL